MTTMAPSLFDQMKERRSALKTERDALFDAALNAKDDKGEVRARPLTPEEDTRVESLSEEIRKVDVRIEELMQEEIRAAAAAAHASPGVSPVESRKEPDIYEKGGPNSYFGDLFRSAKTNDTASAERLRRHAAHEKETRAVGNTNAAGGSGGEWAPPSWIVGEWINLIRPGRVTANLFQHEDVPVGISSLNYPKLLTGTSVGLQSTQNTALSSTDPTTGYIQTGFSTLGGKNVMSQQLMDQGHNFDKVITNDLAAAYAQQVGTQVFTGTGTGSGTNAVINGLGAATISNTVTWTQASPTPQGFYGQTAKLLSAFLTARLAPPTHWVMSPRRWFWLVASVDANGRPLVVPNAVAFNPLASQQDGPHQPAGFVGTLHGLPVYIDPLVPTNIGAGTNQDNVYLIKADDLVLLESPPQVEVFRETYADSLGILIRLYAYVGTILNRHTESIGLLTGTGLITPVWAS